MNVISEPVNPREAAWRWIANTITKRLHPELGGADRIRDLAAAFEDEAHEKNMPIEMAVSLAVEWCEFQNEEVAPSRKGYCGAILRFAVAARSASEQLASQATSAHEWKLMLCE